MDGISYFEWLQTGLSSPAAFALIFGPFLLLFALMYLAWLAVAASRRRQRFLYAASVVAAAALFIAAGALLMPGTSS